MPTPKTEQKKSQHDHEKKEIKQEKDPYEVKVIGSWTAPARPFAKRSNTFFKNSILIALLIEIILFLFGQYMLMVVVLAILFVTYELGTVPPHNLRYQISTEGLTIDDRFYLWQELYDFYFLDIHNNPVLHVRTRSFYPGELVIPLGKVTTDQMRRVLIRFLPYREKVRLTFTEKAGNWLSKTFPLDKPLRKSEHNTVSKQ